MKLINIKIENIYQKDQIKITAKVIPNNISIIFFKMMFSDEFIEKTYIKDGNEIFKNEITENAELFDKIICDQILNYIEQEQEFLKYHYTGHIREDAYENTKFNYINIEQYSILLKEFIDKNGEIIQLRKDPSKLKYVKTNKNKEIERDLNGLALYLNDEEIIEKGLNLTETTIIAVNSDSKVVGMAHDEFGSDGIWVLDEYQKRGIGTELIYEFKKQFKDSRKIGHMTELGIKLTKSYFRKIKENE